MNNKISINDYFSGYEPDLVNKKVMKNFKFVINNAYKSSPIVPENTPVYDHWCFFYSEYIQPNNILILLLFIFVLFLLYRYIMKDDFIEYENKNETMSNIVIGDHVLRKHFDETNNVTNIDYDNQPSNISDQSCDYNITNNVPTFNPYYPTNEQTSYVNYLPNNVPLNINGKYKTYYDVNPRKKYRKLKKINDDSDYNDNNIEYTGTYNTYNNSQDPALPNSIGLIADYNTTTDNAVRSMTDANRRNLDILSQSN
jgi:hypothetical protein